MYDLISSQMLVAQVSDFKSQGKKGPFPNLKPSNWANLTSQNNYDPPLVGVQENNSGIHYSLLFLVNPYAC